MRAVSFVPLFPALWLVVNIILFLRSARDTTSMIFFGAMIAVALGAFLYLSLLAYAPKVLFNLRPGKRCPVCYAKLDKDENFCPKCGNIIDNSLSVNLGTCPKCGAAIEDPERDFCPKCGSELKK